MNDQDKNIPWKRMSFKGNKVWAQTDTDGKLKIENSKVLIKYNLKQDYEYKVNHENLKPESQAIAGKKKKQQAKKSSSKAKSDINQADMNTDIPENCIKIYTDGASSGNPGPSGIGVLFIYKDHKKEISKYIGMATNNIAELTAIKTGLEELKRFDMPVRIFTDSNYSLGLLTKGWKPKANQELVLEIKTLINKFLDLAFIKVKGHSGIKENEVADYLATSAIKKGPH